ncbi:sigma-70 family RNA polymerase sigma factor [Bacillus sp. FJAT-27445]|uniref:sigma-70 family RNA polymerase sigma factor n=1 Tax=Bacillus sp. FJAT-27445 TaxID=1679166 RepID=UPI00074350E9|nr:sigma-70 family RNA polymerase sigma factor [Bacillus sp. FJAT-27445]
MAKKTPVNSFQLMIELNNERGFLTFDDIIDHAEKKSLPIDELDRLCESLILEGIIILDNAPAKTVVQANEENNPGKPEYDKSKLDYNQIYNRVLEIDNSLCEYINFLRDIAPPQHREESLLLHQAIGGNSYARERLITMHLRVALRIALWYHEKYGFNLDETIQEANLGLIVALEKIPENTNSRFSTYAPWWIRQNIDRNTQGLSAVYYRIPAHLQETLYKIVKYKRRHKCAESQKFGNCTNILNKISEQLSLPQETVRKYLNILQDPYSIEDLIENDTISDHNELMDNIERNLELQLLNKNLSELFTLLKDRERKVIELRFGFYDDRPRTLEEVGNLMGVTRERIRQIEYKALKKLEKPLAKILDTSV